MLNTIFKFILKCILIFILFIFVIVFLFFIYDFYKGLKDPCYSKKGREEVGKGYYGFVPEKNLVCVQYMCGRHSFCYKTLEGADQESFKEDGCYEVDKNYVYYNFEKIDIDRKTFKALESCYSKDKDYFYYNDYKIGDIDESSFEVLKFGYAKDKNYIYKGGKRLKRDLETFMVFDEYYSKDKNAVYYNNEVFNVDVATFEIVDHSHSYVKDKDNCYRFNDKVDNSACEYYKSILRIKN